MSDFYKNVHVLNLCICLLDMILHWYYSSVNETRGEGRKDGSTQGNDVDHSRTRFN